MRQIGLVGEVNDAFLDDLVIDRLKSVAMFDCVGVSFGVEFEDRFEAVALVF